MEHITQILAFIKGSPKLFLAMALVSVVPMFASYQLADQTARSAIYEKTTEYTKILEERLDDNILQSTGARNEVEEIGGPPCSPEKIAKMGSVLVKYPKIIIIGYVINDRLICSSLGNHGNGYLIQTTIIKRTDSYSMRIGAVISEISETPSIITERHGYAISVSADQVVDISTIPSDTALGSFSSDINIYRSEKNHPKLLWAFRHQGDTYNFEDDEYLISTRKTKQLETIMVAAIPKTYLVASRKAILPYFFPLGWITGVALAAVLFYYTRRQKSLESRIKRALINNEFYLEYQPVLDLTTHEYIGAEALIRWRTSDGTFIPPDIFIEEAERTGLITKVTDRVFELVEADAPMLFKYHPDFHIAINVSSADILSARLSDKIRNLADKLGVHVNNFIIEATERELLNSIVVNEYLKDIRLSGSTIAIDDFGTGYSSLSYLGNFDLDYLKIDKSFVNSIGTDSATSKVITHIIGIAKSLDLALIAEGVEIGLQAEYLKAHKVRYAQGWLYSKSLPMSTLITFIAQNKK
jgi:sensor c-di-GMP phosphodiesterase-like protein